MTSIRGIAIAGALSVSVAAGAGAQPVISPPVPLTGIPVPEPVVATSENGLALRVVPLAHGLSHPSGMVFLPDGHTMLVVERPVAPRRHRWGARSPTPVAGVPTVHNLSLGGMRDAAPPRLRDQPAPVSVVFEGRPGRNDPRAGAQALRQGRLTDVRDILVADAEVQPAPAPAGA
ncbi:MAG: hypothetical protein R2712_06980 [Vicinamibacterales bacterium]